MNEWSAHAHVSSREAERTEWPSLACRAALEDSCSESGSASVRGHEKRGDAHKLLLERLLVVE